MEHILVVHKGGRLSNRHFSLNHYDKNCYDNHWHVLTQYCNCKKRQMQGTPPAKRLKKTLYLNSYVMLKLLKALTK